MKTRIEYIDTLKFVAIFAVIAIHSFLLGNGVEILHYNISQLSQIFRFAVPVFLMITGALSLNKDINIKEYLNKRINRIFYPLIFFTLLLYLVQISDRIFTYYWYSWMIIGTVFAIPIINKFIQHSNEKEIKYYIGIFIIFSIFYQMTHLFNIESALDMTFFLTPVSYLILGYYLFNKKFDLSKKKIMVISIILFILSTLLKLKFGSFPYTNDFHTYLDLSLLQIIQACSVFIMIKTIYSLKKTIMFRILNQNSVKKFILSVSRASYGMYFIHHPLIYILKPIRLKISDLGFSGTETLILVLTIIIAVFIISWIIVLILSKIPILKKISGYY